MNSLGWNTTIQVMFFFPNSDDFLTLTFQQWWLQKKNTHGLNGAWNFQGIPTKMADLINALLDKKKQTHPTSSKTQAVLKNPFWHSSITAWLIRILDP